MKALDSNIIVRFLIQDDEEQADKVLQLLSENEQLNQSLYVPLLVILEVIWVLQSAYNISRQDIILAISSLLQMSVLAFENQEAIRNFIISANKSAYDLSDLLIVHSAQSASYKTTLTFDKKASKFELFTLL